MSQRTSFQRAAKMGAVDEDKYECKLSEETQKMAKDELREDKNARDQALEQMRNWIKLNPRIQTARLGEIVTSSSNRRECTSAKIYCTLYHSHGKENAHARTLISPLTFKFI